jgi:hypothetical protein
MLAGIDPLGDMRMVGRRCAGLKDSATCSARRRRVVSCSPAANVAHVLHLSHSAPGAMAGTATAVGEYADLRR